MKNKRYWIAGIIIAFVMTLDVTGFLISGL